VIFISKILAITELASMYCDTFPGFNKWSDTHERFCHLCQSFQTCSNTS